MFYQVQINLRHQQKPSGFLFETEVKARKVIIDVMEAKVKGIAAVRVLDDFGHDIVFDTSRIDSAVFADEEAEKKLEKIIRAKQIEDDNKRRAREQLEL